MLIIAKKSEKDYYDGIAGTTGIDKTIVYDRQIIEFEKNDIPIIFEIKRRFWSLKYYKNSFYNIGYHKLKKEYYKIVYDEYAYFIIGFCGKLYIGWKLYNIINDNEHNITTKFTYDIEYIKTILEQKSWNGNLNDRINDIQAYDALQMFRDLNTPIFIYDSDYNRTYLYKNSDNNHYSKFIINPLLKNYGFYKVFNAVQGFQEIQMFLSGVLGNKEKEIINVADKYKIEQHGFDYKWSFRGMKK